MTRQCCRRVVFCRPVVQVLEGRGRSLPSTVTTLADGGPGPLRQAIADTPIANAQDAGKEK
jgi:hypothetical protein